MFYDTSREVCCSAPWCIVVFPLELVTMRTAPLMTSLLLLLALNAQFPARSLAAENKETKSVFAKDNLVVWCIVPFDKAKRGPKDRAELLQQFGITKFAYDWRDEHVPTFEDEILQLKQRNIEFFAFWAFHPQIVPLIRKHGIHPQFWLTVPSPEGNTEEAKVAAAGEALLPIVKQAKELGCKVGLYNHGGWGGEPATMVAVTKWLREKAGTADVGIAYNLHHGHEHIKDFPEVLAAMKPYLLCINLNGMNDNANPKILPIGDGQHERAMMEAIKRSGYNGPIGILGHREELDAAESVKLNLLGMKKVLEQMGDEAAKTY